MGKLILITYTLYVISVRSLCLIWPIKDRARIRLKMILPKLKISHSKYFSWHLSSASQATATASGADTARAWVSNMRRASHWPVRGLRLLSALGSKTLPCVKNYISVEKRGLVEERGKLWLCWRSEGELLCVQAAKLAGWLRWCCCAVGTRVTTAELWLRGSVISLRKCCWFLLRSYSQVLSGNKELKTT